MSLNSSYSRSTMDLLSVLQTAVEDVLEKVTNQTFIDIYKEQLRCFRKKNDVSRPSLSGSSKEAVQYRKQFNDIVMDNIKETLEETVLVLMDIKFKELEKLTSSQPNTSFVW